MTSAFTSEGTTESGTPEGSHDADRHTTGCHRKNQTASTAWAAANAATTRGRRAGGMRTARQKNIGNRTAVNRPTEMNRCAATGGNTLTAIHNPYARPNRRLTGLIAATEVPNATMFPTYVIASVSLTLGSNGSRAGSGAGPRPSSG